MQKITKHDIDGKLLQKTNKASGSSIILYKVNAAMKRNDEHIEGVRDEHRNLLNEWIKKLNKIKIEINKNNSEVKIISFEYGRIISKSNKIHKLFQFDNGSEYNNLISQISPGNEGTEYFSIQHFIIDDEVKLIAVIDDVISLLENGVDFLLGIKNKTSSEIRDELNLSNFTNSSDLNKISIIHDLEQIKILDFYEKPRINDPVSYRFKSLNNIVMGETEKNNFLLNLDLQIDNKNKIEVGILDSKIHKKFYKKFKESGILEYKNLIDGEEDFADDTINNSHAEMVFSTVSFGDVLNNHNDGCGIFSAKIYGILSDSDVSQINSPLNIFKRISKAIKDSPKIKVWILSMGIDGSLERDLRVSPFGQEIDRLSKENNIRFLISGGNEGNEAFVNPLSDSAYGLSIAALDSFLGKPTSYSNKGFRGLLGTKPNFSYFGGDKDNLLITLKENIAGDIVTYGTRGTSFAAPMAARFYARIYNKLQNDINEIEKNYLLHDKVEAMMISAAQKKTSEGDFLNERESKLIGFGKLPITIDEYFDDFMFSINTEFNEATAVFNNGVIALPKINGSYPYELILTSVDNSIVSHEKGVEFLRNSTEVIIYSKKGVKMANELSRKEIEDSFAIIPFGKYFIDSNGVRKTFEDQLIMNGKYQRNFSITYKMNDIFNKMIKNPDDNLSLKITRNRREIDSNENKTTKTLSSNFVWNFRFASNVTDDEKKEFYEALKNIHEKKLGHKVDIIKIIAPPAPPAPPAL